MKRCGLQDCIHIGVHGPMAYSAHVYIPCSVILFCVFSIFLFYCEIWNTVCIGKILDNSCMSQDERLSANLCLMFVSFQEQLAVE